MSAVSKAGFEAALREVAESLCVHSAREFSVFGERYETPEAAGSTAPDSVLHPHARKLLSDALYSALHCRLSRDPPMPSALLADRLGARGFAMRLADANCGRGTWQSGWVARGVHADGRIVAEIFGLRFWISPSDLRADTPEPEAGQAVRVRVPKEYRHLHPGFYTALGDADEDLESSPTVRVYWHIHHEGAAPLTALLTQALNAARVPFLLKLPDDALRYARADAAVLIVPRARYREAAPLLAAVHGRVGEFMRTPLSAYVKPLARGLGVADDPGDGSSFGEQRSALLASALVRPEAAYAASSGERVAHVTAALRQAGYELVAFFLNPGSADDFEPFDDGAPNAA